MSVWPNFRRDLRRIREIKGKGTFRTFVEAMLFDSGFQALAAYRMGSSFRKWGWPVLPAVFRRWAIGSCGIDILPQARIGGGCYIAHGLGLVVGGTTVIGEDCTLLQGVTLGEARFSEDACPRIGNRVTIGVNAVVLGGVSVGDDAFVGAGAVVLEDVPAASLAVGTPARSRPLTNG
ncbi:MAG: serine O-acetyltransferase [Thermoanaerobaculia bacterium]|jgi:serine O-acetyltransferase